MSDGPSGWFQFLTAKTPESWIAVIIGIIYVFYRSGAFTRIARAIEAGLSGLIAVALSPDIIETTGYPPVIVYFMVSVLGFTTLDLLTSIVSDKKELGAMAKDFLRYWLRLDKGNGDKK